MERFALTVIVHTTGMHLSGSVNRILHLLVNLDIIIIHRYQNVFCVQMYFLIARYVQVVIIVVNA